MPNHATLAAPLLFVASILLSAGACAQYAAKQPVITGGTLQPADPSTELLHSGAVTLTRGDYDLQLSRLPEDSRAGFGTSIERVNALLRVMLVDKTLAKEARDTGIDKDPELQAKIAAETERMLSQAVMERNTAKWEKEFDTRPNIEAAARERWLTQQDKYRRSGEVKLTEIVYTTAKHTPGEARAMAQAARQKITAGADMAALAKSESEASSAASGGQLDWKTADDFDQRIARAAFGLKNVGDLSRPVESDDGVHLLRLDGKRPGQVKPFEQVKASIITEMRREYVDSMRTERLAAIRNDPSIVVNQPAVDALIVRVNPEFLEKAPEHMQRPPGLDRAPGTPPPK